MTTSADQIERASATIRSLMDSGAIGLLSATLLDAAPALADLLDLAWGACRSEHEAMATVARAILREEATS